MLPGIFFVFVMYPCTSQVTIYSLQTRPIYNNISLHTSWPWTSKQHLAIQQESHIVKVKFDDHAGRQRTQCEHIHILFTKPLHILLDGGKAERMKIQLSQICFTSSLKLLDNAVHTVELVFSLHMPLTLYLLMRTR